MTKNSVRKTSTFFTLLMFVVLNSPIIGSISTAAHAQDISITAPASDGPQIESTDIEVINPHYAIEQITYTDGTRISGHRVNGPSSPPEAFAGEREASILLIGGAVSIPNFPSYDWVFGCGAVAGAMIAAYYDRGAYPNIYTGPTNGGVMPISNADTAWGTWTDGDGDTYPNNPLIASHLGVDGRTTRGSIDDYWVKYGSTDKDPYITGGWEQHYWGTAIGDYMKTSQSKYNNTDGQTWLYYYQNDSRKYHCSDMETYNKDTLDGTYGRKLFYEARGYSVTDCYNQKTDNKITGGFSLEDFKAEIDGGHPVYLFVTGHFMVGYGYNGDTIYIRDTWDSNPSKTYTMTWGGSYQDMELLAVGVVHPGPLGAQVPSAPTGVKASDGTYAEKVRVTWNASSRASYYQVYRNTTNSSSGATQIKTNHPSSPYDDTAATMGKEYTYWIKACNTAGCSGLSACDSGYRQVVTYNQFLYLPLALNDAGIIPGFDSQFNSDSEGWVAHSGKWLHYENKHIYTDGVPGSISSISYEADFTNLDYKVQLYRYGGDDSANRIIIRGTPSPLSGIKDWYSQYIFQYSRSGYYSVFKFVKGEFFTLKDWTYSDTINQANSWNLLRVLGEGGKLTFYINGKQVWSGTDSALTSGRVGIGMYRDDESTDNRLYVDWAKLTTEGLGGADASTSVDFEFPEGQALYDAIDLEGGADPNSAPGD